MLVAEEGDFGFACIGVPETWDLIITGREEPAAVVRGCDAAHPVGVAFECLETVAGCDVPYLEGLVAGGGYKSVS